MLKEILSDQVQEFVRQHADDDAADLFLRFSSDSSSFHLKKAVDQIISRRKAKEKLPLWFKTRGIVFPPPLSIEQCSSEVTAKFKSELFSGNLAADITGGSGVDSAFLSKQFEKVECIEKQDKLLDITRHNFKQLGISNIECINQTAESFAENAGKKYDLIFIDPSRRVEGKKVFGLQDSEPDVSGLLPMLNKISKDVLIKTSPLLDIKKTIDDLINIKNVYVVAVKNEVKEVLYHSSTNSIDAPAKIHCTNILSKGREDFTFDYNLELKAVAKYGEVSEGKYLYEPNRAILKAGAYKIIGNHFQLRKLHPNTHFYTSDTITSQFPGRVFRIVEIVDSVSRRIKGRKFNVIARNYPLSAKAIQKEYRLTDGGENFLIAARSINKLLLMVCRKVLKS